MAEYSVEWKDNVNRWAIYEWSIYPRGSVLEGQNCKRFVEYIATVDEANRKYPGIDVGFRDPHNYYNHLPGEDDPVPGGMYPDDIDDGV
jgi:hypothetical protein